jgi:hypothetical protein
MEGVNGGDSHVEGKNAEKQVLRFKDAVGRKFVIPFPMVKTWQVRA